MNLQLAATIWASLATVGALAAAFIRWRSSSDETAATLWREEAEAWKAKAERLESSLISLERRVGALETENRALRALHDDRAELAALRTSLAEGVALILTRLSHLED